MSDFPRFAWTPFVVPSGSGTINRSDPLTPKVEVPLVRQRWRWSVAWLESACKFVAAESEERKAIRSFRPGYGFQRSSAGNEGDRSSACGIADDALASLTARLFVSFFFADHRRQEARCFSMSRGSCVHQVSHVPDATCLRYEIFPSTPSDHLPFLISGIVGSMDS